MTGYELHPLCTLFPQMAGAEFSALCDDIKLNGLRYPIILHEGMILDGGHRYRACLEIGAEPRFDEYVGGDIVSFVLSANLQRRHMTIGQQAAVVASAQDWARAQVHGGDRKSIAHREHLLDTTAHRAEQSGASIATQRRADAVSKADPELARQVAHGEISLASAIKSVAPQLDPHPKEQAGERAQNEPYVPPKAPITRATLNARIASLELSCKIARTRIDILEKEKVELEEQLREMAEEMNHMLKELNTYRLSELEPTEQQAEYRAMQDQLEEAEERARIADALKNDALEKNNDLIVKLKGWETYGRKQRQAG